MSGEIPMDPEEVGEDKGWTLGPEVDLAESQSSSPDMRLASEMARWMQDNPAPRDDAEILTRPRPDGTNEFRWTEAGESPEASSSNTNG